MLDFVVYLLYRAGLAVVAALPLQLLFACGQFLGTCAWIFSGKYRRLATRNLEIAFANEKSPRELRQLVRCHFRRLGANVMIPDYVGYGLSGGSPSEAGCYATADTAYEHLKGRKDVDPGKIVAAGWSMGGGVAVDLAARRPV